MIWVMPTIFVTNWNKVAVQLKRIVAALVCSLTDKPTNVPMRVPSNKTMRHVLYSLKIQKARNFFDQTKIIFLNPPPGAKLGGKSLKTPKCRQMV